MLVHGLTAVHGCTHVHARWPAERVSHGYVEVMVLRQVRCLQIAVKVAWKLLAPHKARCAKKRFFVVFLKIIVYCQ